MNPSTGTGQEEGGGEASKEEKIWKYGQGKLVEDNEDDGQGRGRFSTNQGRRREGEGEGEREFVF